MKSILKEAVIKVFEIPKVGKEGDTLLEMQVMDTVYSILFVSYFC